MIRTVRLALLLCLPLGSAWAQFTVPPAAPSAGPTSPPAIAAPAARAEPSLAALRDKLQLQEAQWPVWQAYAAAIDAYLQWHYQSRPVLAAGHESALLQIRRLVDQQSNRLAALEEIETAAKALYASLNPEQRTLANQQLLATIPSIGSAGPDSPLGGDRGRPEPGRNGHRPGGMGGMGGGPGGGMGR